MPGYVVFHAEVTDPAAYEEFKRLAEAAIAKHGGRYLVRGGALEVLEGDWLPRSTPPPAKCVTGAPTPRWPPSPAWVTTPTSASG